MIVTADYPEQCTAELQFFVILWYNHCYVFNLSCKLTDDIINQAKDSNAKFIVGSQRFISKTIDVANALPQQIKVCI